VDKSFRKNTLTHQTPGTLDLNIARLEHHIKLLEQQLTMCATYPHHKLKLAEEKLQVQCQLEQLRQYRDTLK